MSEVTKKMRSKKGSPHRLPELADELGNESAEGDKLGARIEAKIQDRLDRQDEAACRDPKSSPSHLNDYMDLMQSMIPTLSARTWNAISLALSESYPDTPLFQYSKEELFMDMRLSTFSGINQTEWDELCLQASRVPESLDDQFMELRELGILFKTAEQAGVADAMLMILHRVSEMLLRREYSVEDAVYSALKRADPDDSALETRLDLWRIRGGLYVTAVRELPPTFELVFMEPVLVWGRRTQETTTHYIAFPTFGGCIPTDLRTAIEMAPTWSESRQALMEFMEGDESYPFTSLNLCLHYPKLNTDKAFKMTIFSEQTYLPKHWGEECNSRISPSGSSMRVFDVLRRRLKHKSNSEKQLLDVKLLAPFVLSEFKILIKSKADLVKGERQT